MDVRCLCALFVRVVCALKVVFHEVGSDTGKTDCIKNPPRLDHHPTCRKQWNVHGFSIGIFWKPRGILWESYGIRGTFSGFRAIGSSGWAGYDLGQEAVPVPWAGYDLPGLDQKCKGSTEIDIEWYRYVQICIDMYRWYRYVQIWI